MNFSTLNPLEWKESKVLDKFEKSKESTTSTFIWKLVKRRSMFKQKKSKNPFSFKLKLLWKYILLYPKAWEFQGKKFKCIDKMDFSIN